MRYFLHSFLYLSAGVGVMSCTSVPPQQLSKTQVIDRVTALPHTPEKQVALAVINHPDSEYRVDSHGYPAWRWRGNDDLGSCVHIDPTTDKPYLENQFSWSERSIVQKYIDFETDGTHWQCRMHVERLGVDVERNWSNPVCDQRGQKLMQQLSKALQVKS